MRPAQRRAYPKRLAMRAKAAGDSAAALRHMAVSGRSRTFALERLVWLGQESARWDQLAAGGCKEIGTGGSWDGSRWGGSRGVGVGGCCDKIRGVGTGGY